MASKRGHFWPKADLFLHFICIHFHTRADKDSEQSNKMASLVEGNGPLRGLGVGSGVSAGKSATKQ